MKGLFSRNGRVLPYRRAMVSALDRGFLYGDSAYETLRSYEGRPFLFREHWRRLRASCARLGIPFPWKRDAQEAFVMGLLKRARLKSAHVRIIVTRGEGAIRMAPERGLRPNLLYYVQLFTPLPASLYRRGAAVALVGLRRNPIESLDPRIKSSNLLNNVLASIQAGRQRALEALMLNSAGDLVEGASSNLFLVRHGAVLTPPLSEGLLGGITRAIVFRIARLEKIEIRERVLGERALRHCDEAFITSTLREILPLRSCNGRLLGNGRPGPVTLRLGCAFQRFRDKWICRASGR